MELTPAAGGLSRYEGTILWHEGEIKFTRDVTLTGNVPIPLLALTCPQEKIGDGNVLVVSDADDGTRVEILRDPRHGMTVNGRIRPGGYAALMPALVGYNGFLAPQGSDFCYSCDMPGQLTIGLGKDGQHVKAGTVLRYRFAVGAFADQHGGNTLLEHTVRTMNFDGKHNGYTVLMKTGMLEDALFFFTARANDHEAAFTLGPQKLIIDLPIRVNGVQDNGCAAVYSTKRPWFRFVPVENSTAWFQEPIEETNDMWAGNVFLADNADVKITLVMDGQAPGAPPFLEVHNPTTASITTLVRSPQHTPIFGGIKAEVTIPAGNSIRLRITNGAMQPMK